MINKINYRSSFFHNYDEAIKFLIEIRAIREIRICEKCNTEVLLKRIIRDEKIVYLYRCTKKNCRYSKNLLQYSLFGNAKFELPLLLFSIYCIMCNISNYSYCSLVSISEKTYIRIKDKLLNIYDIMLANEEMLGGENVYIEVDETVISSSGNIRYPSAMDDDTPGTVWLFGIIERNNPRNFRLVIIPNRQVETLTEMLKKFVRKNSIIVSDGYPSYPSAVKNIGCIHIVVPHVNGFVNDDGESSNKIENLWSHLKNDITAKHGVQYNKIEPYLKSFSFRKKFLTNIKPSERVSIFIRICQLCFS